jgi:YesN/AraC family two-component response regulator
MVRNGMDSNNNPAVLIVEDDPLIRMTAADLIADAGWEAFEAANAEEALKVIDEHPEIRVLFTDVNMPGPVDGIRLAECVNRDHPRIELVVTSGRQYFNDAALPDEGTFLPKPYGQADLVRVLREKLC